MEDPDSQTLTNWLDHGAPLGYTQPIPTNGIFPVVDGEGWKEENLKNLSRSLAGWVNYESAIEEADTLADLIDDGSEEEATQELGARPILNRLGPP